MKTEYSVDWFIQFFQSVPDEKWRTFSVGYPDGPNCAIGLCRYVIDGGIVDDTGYGPTERVLGRLIADAFASDYTLENLTIVTDINDDKNRHFPQPTPKARILAALYAIKAKQTPKPPALVLAPAAWPVVAMPLPTEKPEAVVV